MSFRPPIVPSRAAEMIIFVPMIFANLAMLAYLIWGEIRGLLDWMSVALFWVLCIFSSLPVIGIGLLLRRYRLRKAAALSEYHRALALASQG